MPSNETLPTISTTTGTYFSYTIPGMDINSGPMIYTLVSQFMGVITPNELPLAQVRQLLHSNLTLTEFATNAIKVESGFIALMSIFMILAVVPLLATCCWCCCRRSPEEDEQFIRSASSTMIDESLEDSLHCRKSASITTLWIIFIFLSLCDLCIFYANSRLATTVEMTPEMIKSTVHDMEVFLKDTHLQIKHKLDNGFHVSVEKVVKDLEDVDVLLGEPIQAEISAHTGIELAYDSLATLSLANAELIYRVLMLQETVGRALKISQEASARMEELQIQLSVLQRQCTYRDRPLCDTLRIRSFEENGIIDALKTLQEDQTIFRMRYLGEIEIGASVRNLTSEVGLSRSIFSNFPQQVKLDTAYERNYTLEQLESIRHRTTANAQMLTATINVLLHRLEGVWDSVKPHYDKLQEWSDIYWTTGWVAGMVIVWILLFFLMSYCCFLCESNVKAGVILFIAVLIICLSSICITTYGVLSLAIGGNAEVFLCKPMYDAGVSVVQRMDPTTGLTVRSDMGNSGYEVLGKLFDKPGYVYDFEPQVGIIGELLRPDGVNRPIVNVSLATALSGCERNEASYNVFQLDAFVNTTEISNLKQFPKVTQAIDSIDVSERTLLSLTQTIQTILESMLQTSAFNLTTYRATIGAPTPEKDLATFIDQMQRVALQIQDVATSSRMTTLGSRSKRLQASILQPLEQLQNEILYHLTALELQRDPWAKQVNQTLNHLRNIQEYLEKTAGEICDNQTRIYTERLKTYLTSSKATMSSQLGDTTAKCRPFFDIFDANRIFLCRNMIDFINALWFCTFITLLLWSIGTPVGLNLISLQRKLTNLKLAKMRAAERARNRDDSAPRGRRRDRGGAPTSRDRSTSSAGPRKPAPLRRSATEETLDIDIDNEQRESSERDRRSRSREASQSPGRGRGQVRRPDVNVEDNWRSPSASRGTSRERMSNERERERERSQARGGTAGKSKPQMQRRGTQEFDIDEEEGWASSGRVSRSEPRREEGRRQNVGRSNMAGQKPQIRRQGTEEFDIEQEETWTSSGRDGHTESRQEEGRIKSIARNILTGQKPLIRRQGTQEFDIEQEEIWTSSGRVSRTEPRKEEGGRIKSLARNILTGQKPIIRRQGTQDSILDEDGILQVSERQTDYGRPESQPEQGRREAYAQQGTYAGQKFKLRKQEISADEDRAWQSPKSTTRMGRYEGRRDEDPRETYARTTSTGDKPKIRRQGTQEFSLDGNEAWQSPPPSNARGRSEPRRGEGRGRDNDTRSTSVGQQRSRRSVTPALPTRPDAQPAQPAPRTPTRLRSRVSLTTRAVANIVKNRPNTNKVLKRRDTEDFDLDDENQYGTTGRSMQAVNAARRTPPRSAPPPPPPPSNRFSNVRTVRWTTEEDDVVFEDCDSPNPMYMIHDLND